MGGPQFHLSSLPHKRENGTTNAIPGVTLLPNSIFKGVGMCVYVCVCQLCDSDFKPQFPERDLMRDAIRSAPFPSRAG